MAIQEGSSNIYWRYNDGYIEAAPGRRRDWKVWGSPGFKFIIGKLVEGERLCVTVTTDNRKRLIAKAPCPPRGRRLTVRLTDNRLFCKGYARCTDMCYFQFCSTGEYVAKDADDQMYLVKDFRKKWSMKCNWIGIFAKINTKTKRLNGVSLTKRNARRPNNAYKHKQNCARQLWHSPIWSQVVLLYNGSCACYCSLPAFSASSFSLFHISPLRLHVAGLEMRFWREINFLAKQSAIRCGCVTFVVSWCWNVDMCSQNHCKVTKGVAADSLQA